MRGDTDQLVTKQKRTARAEKHARAISRFQNTKTPEAIALRRIVVVLQDLLRTAKAPYTTYADVKADLASTLAKLQLPYDSGQLAEALDQVERGGQQPIVAPTVARKTPESKLLPDASPHFSREDATRLLDALKVGTKGMR
jgi:hypothetical protein